MILTNCAACAAPLAHDAPRCVRCQHRTTLAAAINLGALLVKLNRFEEAKVLLRKVLPAVRRTQGESHVNTLKMRWNYADALHLDADATLDDLREAVTTFEETERIARRVLGGAHPITEGIEDGLQHARAALCAGEAPPSSSGGA